MIGSAKVLLLAVRRAPLGAPFVRCFVSQEWRRWAVFLTAFPCRIWHKSLYEQKYARWFREFIPWQKTARKLDHETYQWRDGIESHLWIWMKALPKYYFWYQQRPKWQMAAECSMLVTAATWVILLSRNVRLNKCSRVQRLFLETTSSAQSPTVAKCTVASAVFYEQFWSKGWCWSCKSWLL